MERASAGTPPPAPRLGAATIGDFDAQQTYAEGRHDLSERSLQPISRG